MSVARCLVIQDDCCPSAGNVANALTPDRGFACDVVHWSSLIPDNLPGCTADLIVTLAIPDPAPALRLFEWLAHHPVPRPIFAVLPDPVEDGVIACAAKAVDDFVLLPLREGELRHRLARLLAPSGSDSESITARLSAAVTLCNLVGDDPAFLRAIAQLPRIAMSDMPVLVVGETGTGK